MKPEQWSLEQQVLGLLTRPLEQELRAGQFDRVRTLLARLGTDSGNARDEHYEDRWREAVRLWEALDYFENGNYAKAVDVFLTRVEHWEEKFRLLQRAETTPAIKVISLFPSAVSAKSHYKSAVWAPRFIHAPGLRIIDAPTTALETSIESSRAKKAKPIARRSLMTKAAPSVSVTVASPVPASLAKDDSSSQSSTAGKILARQAASATFHTTSKASADSDRASIRSSRSTRSLRSSLGPQTESSKDRPAVSMLIRYVTERRRTVISCLNTVSDDLTPAERAALTEEAVLVDTTLFRSYAYLTPSLLGSLIRTPNYCDVGVCEEILRSAQKWSELVELFRTKGRHEEALAILQSQVDKADGPEQSEARQEVYRYCMRLRVEDFRHDKAIRAGILTLAQRDAEALAIFTSEESGLNHLEADETLEFLSQTQCEGPYLHHLIVHCGQKEQKYHDRLASCYIDQWKISTSEERMTPYQSLLTFMRSSLYYNPVILQRRLPPNDLWEARAICLGRQKSHEKALRIYLGQLNDTMKAENWCDLAVRQSLAGPEIFLLLLKLYLEQDEKKKPPIEARLDQAIDLLDRRGTTIEASEALTHLPALVPLDTIHRYLVHRSRLKCAQVIGESMTLKLLQSEELRLKGRLGQRSGTSVKITDSRMCPVCSKRMGNSVLAVFTDGAVTHYGCRERYLKAA